MNSTDSVHCFLNSSDGVARWGLDIGGRRSSLSAEELDIKAEGLVESISVVFNELLRREGIKVSEIDQVSFILGPGSFTSLRTSYSFLQGLIAPYKIKLVGISLFLAYLLSTKLDTLGEVKLSLRANAEENFVAEFILNSKSSISSSTPDAKSIEVSNSASFIKLPEVFNTFDLMEATYTIPHLDQESLTSLTRAGHLHIGSGPCELLYIKGVSAKTLKERGVV